MKKALLGALLAIALLGVLALRARGAREQAAHRAPEGRATSSAPARDDDEGTAAPVAGESAAAAAPEAEAAVARVTLLGQVIDTDEAPVSGAVVHLGGPEPKDATTDDGGVFRFTILPGPYLLAARAGDRVSPPLHMTITADTEAVTLRLAPASTLEALVIDGARGTPIAGATVTVRCTPAVEATTDAAGIARVAGVSPATVDVVAVAPGYAAATAAVPLGGGARRTELRLVRGGGLAGTVVDEAGRPVGGARVVVDPLTAAFTPPGALGATTGPDGRFAIPGLAAATYAVSASHEEAGACDEPHVSVVASTSPTEVALTLRRGATLAGRVVSDAGRPIAGALVRVLPAEYAAADLFARETRSDATGRFRVVGLKAGRVRATASTPVSSSSPQFSELPSTGTRSVTLTLDGDQEIAGVVRDRAGAPVADAQVIALPHREGSASTGLPARAAAQAVSDSAGRFRFTQLAHGRYGLRAGTAGSADTGDILNHPEVVVDSGTTDARVVLDAGRRARGRVAMRDGSPTPRFTVSLGSAAATSFAGGDGSFELRDVVPGRHLLAVAGDGVQKRAGIEVDVPDADDAELGTIVVDRARMLTGRVVTQDGSPVEGAAVHVGSMILAGGGFDGASGASADEMLGGSVTLSGADGSFTAYAREGGPCYVFADRADVGRSSTVAVPESLGDAQTTLTLAPTGAVEGTVTHAGAPVPGQLVVAVPIDSPRTRFAVRTALDGTYRFDALAAGAYNLAAKVDGTDASPTLRTVPVRVEARATAHADITSPGGDGRLRVTLAAPGGPVDARVYLFSGAVQAQTIGDIEVAMASRGDGSTRIGGAIGGAPATFDGLEPGDYTACALAAPLSSSDPNAIQRTRLRGVRNAVSCRPVSVSGAEADLTIPSS